MFRKTKKEKEKYEIEFERAIQRISKYLDVEPDLNKLNETLEQCIYHAEKQGQQLRRERNYKIITPTIEKTPNKKIYSTFELIRDLSHALEMPKAYFQDNVRLRDKNMLLDYLQSCSLYASLRKFEFEAIGREKAGRNTHILSD